MKEYLEMFDGHLGEVVAAFSGDDDTLQPLSLYDDDYSFEVDLSSILMGDLDQLDGGSIFFVVQNKAGSGQCYSLQHSGGQAGEVQEHQNCSAQRKHQIVGRLSWVPLLLLVLCSRFFEFLSIVGF